MNTENRAQLFAYYSIVRLPWQIIFTLVAADDNMLYNLSEQTIEQSFPYTFWWYNKYGFIDGAGLL